ncbi:hypothetical protein MJD09_28360, partial [bacterium]|nr:hypothetical protein [bacterium]
NPVTSMLEPVGFDANAGRELVHVTGSNRSLNDAVHKFKDLAFSDLALYERYLQELERLTDPRYLDDLFASIEEQLQENLNIIYREFPYFYYSKEVFYQNQQSIKYALNPAKGLHAYFNQSDGNNIELEVGNIHALPVEVLGLVYGENVRLRASERVILEPKASYQPIDFKKFEFAAPSAFAWADTMSGDLKIHYRILGATQRRDAEVYSWPRLVDDFLESDFIRREANFREFDFLVIDDSEKTVSLKPGNWLIDRDLIIPKGYQVVARAGTRLDLVRGAVMLSYSPFDFKGTEEAPIVVQSQDSTGQGIVVMRAVQPSVLEYVRCQYLSNPAKGAWTLTGAVTFYESPVRISHSQFVRNHCEDGLNIIRSEFTMDHVLFDGTQSDAFDGDWVKGKITNSVFIDSGNDAIDVSGSSIEIEDVLIERAGDKGLSAGENSQMFANNVKVVDSEIAVASKDMSEIKIGKIDITDCQVGFTLYQKKPEFGGGVVTVNKLNKNNLRMSHLVEPSSRLKLEGSVVAANAERVESILYGVEFGKASKRATN